MIIFVLTNESKVVQQKLTSKECSNGKHFINRAKIVMLQMQIHSDVEEKYIFFSAASYFMTYPYFSHSLPLSLSHSLPLTLYSHFSNSLSLSLPPSIPSLSHAHTHAFSLSFIYCLLHTHTHK